MKTKFVNKFLTSISFNKLTLLSLFLFPNLLWAQAPREKAAEMLAPIFKQYENYYCEFLYSSNSRPEKSKCKYWRVGDSEKSYGEFFKDNPQIDVKHQGTLSHYNQRTKSAQIMKRKPTDTLGQGDIPHALGLRMVNDERSNQFLSYFLESSQYPVSLKALENGDYELKITNKYGDRIFTLAKAFNYHPTLVRSFNLNGFHFFKSEISQFKELAPGQFFPTKVHDIFFDEKEMDNPGKILDEGFREITKINIKDRIPVSVFELKYPEGAKISDEFNGSYSIVQADGTKRKTKFEVATRDQIKLDAKKAPTQTESNPNATYWYASLGFLAIFLVGISSLVFKKFRAAPEKSQ